MAKIKIDVVYDIILDLLKLYRKESVGIVSTQLQKRRESVSATDFLAPKIRDITTFYIRRFCNQKVIAEDQTRLLQLRHLVEAVRTEMWFPVTKKYALMLKVSQDKDEKVMLI